MHMILRTQWVFSTMGSPLITLHSYPHDLQCLRVRSKHTAPNLTQSHGVISKAISLPWSDGSNLVQTILVLVYLDADWFTTMNRRLSSCEAFTRRSVSLWPSPADYLSPFTSSPLNRLLSHRRPHRKPAYHGYRSWHASSRSRFFVFMPPHRSPCANMVRHP